MNRVSAWCRRLPAAWLLIPAVLAACDHPAPFSSADAAGNPPVVIGGVRRLTFSVDGDFEPRFLPGGERLGFSYRLPERADRDRCLALYDLALGRIGDLVCRRGDLDGDSVNAIIGNAVSPGGRLAYLYEAGHIGLYAPSSRSLYLGDVARPGQATRVLNFPIPAASGLTHHSAWHLTWLGEDTLLYVALHVQYIPGAIGIDPDTNAFPLEIGIVDLTSGAAVTSVVPGTTAATSVAVGAGTRDVYATFAFDSVVYRLDVATGARTPAYDFGALGTVRDVRVAGDRLVAVVGGRLLPAPSDLFQVDTQFDEGGLLYSVRLPNGPPQALNDLQHFFRFPTLAGPAGPVVAQGFPLNITAQQFPVPHNDTVVTHPSDLFLWP